MTLMNIGLLAILLLVLFCPFVIKKIEEEIEIFLFIMGIIAVSITFQWNIELIHESLVEPIKITLAVFLAGLLFNFLQKYLKTGIIKAAHRIGNRLFIFIIITFLGLLSSMITAIIASLILVEIISILKFDRKNEIKIVICACFSIGLGAALTPIGEPLSTIVIGKLKGDPYHADFFFLAREFWHYIIPGVILSALIGAFITAKENSGHRGLSEDRKESFRDIIIRTVKVYFFVMALVFLGTGFKPIIDVYISKIPYQGLYWINMISAVLDNATLAAAEVGPAMEMIQIKSALLGLLISGGMLIPGNIPNIISAGKLKIKSTEWARFGVPVGLLMMIGYFIVLVLT